MATNFVQEGNVLNWYNGTGNAVVSGQVVQVGQRGLGVALVDIASAATGSVMVDGVFELAKDTADALTVGAPVWWDGTKCYNDVGLGRWYIGTAAEAAGATDTTAPVKLGRFVEEGPRVLTLAATGNQSIGVADLVSGNLSLYVPNTGAKTLAIASVTLIPKSFLRVTKTDATAQAITLDPAGDELIAGGSTHATIDANNDTAQFQSTGAAWVVVSSAIAG